MKTMNLKHLLAVLAIASFAKPSHAQTSIQLSNYGAASTLAPNEIIYLAVEPETNVKVTIDIKNTSNSTKSYIAKRYDMILNADATSTAQAYFCIAGSCYGPPTLVSPTALTLTPQQSASSLQGPFEMLIADLDEASTKGYSYVKYTFQNTADAADSVQIGMKYNTPTVPTGINSYSKSDFGLEVGPIPAKEVITLRTSKMPTDGCVTIINAVGKVIYRKDIAKVQAEEGISIDLSDKASGVYYLVLSSQGQVVTRKLVKE